MWKGRTFARLLVSSSVLLVGFGAGPLVGNAGASPASPVLSPAPVGSPIGSYQDQQNISVSGSGFDPGSQIEILECADPGGTSAGLPTDDTTCDGNTIQGPTILTDSSGSFSFSDYTIYALPSSLLFENPGGQPVCDVTNACVLYVGENYQDFTKPKAFSQPFYVGSGSSGGAPTVTSISPTTGPAAGGTTVTITGTGFSTNDTIVDFGTVAATSVSCSSATSCTAVSPAESGSTAVVDVTVDVGGQTSATSSADQFTYTSTSSAPTVTAISPTSGPASGGTSVTVTGTGFSTTAGATTVAFGSVNSTSVTCSSATWCTVLSPADTGTIDVRVTVGGQTSVTSSADQFTYTAVSAPTVTAVSPTSGPVAGGTNVTVTGTNFTGATAVDFGTVAATNFSVASATEISAVSPAAAATGTVDITVTTPAGASATSAADEYAYSSGTVGVGLTGSGSSFAGPAVDDWQGAVSRAPYNLNVNYTTTSSADGRYNFANQTVDFAVTDIPYNAMDTKSPSFPFIYVPLVAEGVAFMYHINGLNTTLQLSSYSACAVFTGNVEYWDDPIIKADNPGVLLPHTAVRPVIRSDLAGTNLVLQEYCIHEQPQMWADFVNSSAVQNYPGQVADLSATQPHADWPLFTNAIPVNGSSNAAATVVNPNNNGYITAVEPAYASELNYPVASVKNASGDYTQPTSVGVASALAYASQQSNGTQVLDFDGQGPLVYNPSTYVYLLAPTTGWNPNKGAVLSQFVDYALTLGQQPAPQGYGSLGRALETYGIDSVLSNVPGAVPPTAAEESALECGDFTPVEVQEGQNSPSCSATVLEGEGGTFAEPIIDKVLGDDQSGLGGLSTTYDSNQDVDVGRANFASGETDFAVSEFPLTSAEQATASTQHRSYAYVPFAAIPVAIGATVLCSNDQMLKPTTVCPDLQLSVPLLEGIFTDGIDQWNSAQLATISDGKPINPVKNAITPQWSAAPSASTEALISAFMNDPTDEASWGAYLTAQDINPTTYTPGETWPTGGGVALGDQGLLDDLVPINESTGEPVTDPQAWGLGDIAPIPADWLGPPTNIGPNGMTIAIENAAGAYVSVGTPSESVAAATAALNDATVNTSTNLITFNASTSDKAAYPIMVMSYLIVPTSGLSSVKATALSNLITFALGPMGESDIEAMGAAPVTGALQQAGLAVAKEVAAQSGNSSPPSISAITAITPTSGPAAGGTTVTISGTGFTGATAVDFGSTPAASFTVNSDTSITATSPAEQAGTVDVTVTTPAGTSATSSADQYTYVAPPAIPTVTGISPSSGTAAGRTKVTITGTNLTGATAVDFGNVAAKRFRVISPTQITATSPAESTGSVDVTVTTPSGTSTTSPTDQYTYVAPLPLVTLVSPASGPTSGFTSVLIAGKNFTGAKEVTFGSHQASFVVLRPTLILAVTPKVSSPGTVSVTVLTSSGSSAASGGATFTYVRPRPFRGPSGYHEGRH